MGKKIVSILPDMKKCCGCFSCYNICPVGAINKYQDNKGFYYPVIDTNKCVNCRRCMKSCPVINNTVIKK